MMPTVEGSTDKGGWVCVGWDVCMCGMCACVPVRGLGAEMGGGVEDTP